MSNADKIEQALQTANESYLKVQHESKGVIYSDQEHTVVGLLNASHVLQVAQTALLQDILEELRIANRG